VAACCARDIINIYLIYCQAKPTRELNPPLAGAWQSAENTLNFSEHKLSSTLPVISLFCNISKHPLHINIIKKVLLDTNIMMTYLAQGTYSD
jgi:hypothetical protein